MSAFAIAGLFLDIVAKAKKTYDQFRERAKQDGELTPEQEAKLDSREDALFGRYEHAAPPPPPERPGA